MAISERKVRRTTRVGERAAEEYTGSGTRSEERTARRLRRTSQVELGAAFRSPDVEHSLLAEPERCAYSLQLKRNPVLLGLASRPSGLPLHTDEEDVMRSVLVVALAVFS